MNLLFTPAQQEDELFPPGKSSPATSTSYNLKHQQPDFRFLKLTLAALVCFALFQLFFLQAIETRLFQKLEFLKSTQLSTPVNPTFETITEPDELTQPPRSEPTDEASLTI